MIRSLLAALVIGGCVWSLPMHAVVDGSVVPQTFSEGGEPETVLDPCEDDQITGYGPVVVRPASIWNRRLPALRPFMLIRPIAPPRQPPKPG